MRRNNLASLSLNAAYFLGKTITALVYSQLRFLDPTARYVLLYMLLNSTNAIIYVMWGCSVKGKRLFEIKVVSYVMEVVISAMLFTGTIFATKFHLKQNTSVGAQLSSSVFYGTLLTSDAVFFGIAFITTLYKITLNWCLYSGFYTAAFLYLAATSLDVYNQKS
ncbi:hypothetical protein BJ742DRAFT_745187 [Cladochytrium replicatum]|nr:hypothetical protein BJ742DRAFT_745187 [Cladochytrium replicatum]